jgi:type IV secretion system protein VirD4
MGRRIWAWFCRANLVAAIGWAGLGVGVFAERYPLHVGILAIGVAWRRLRRREAATSHGSARVATQAEIAGSGLYGGGSDTLIFGRALGEKPSRLPALASLLWPFHRSEDAVDQFTAAFLGGRAYRDRFLTVRDFTHILTVAPAGSGKGVGSVILNLLHYRGNTLVFDPKGENFRETHRHRRAAFGHRIIRLDPTGMHGPGDTFNPFDLLNPARNDFVESCRDVASMMVVRTGKEHDTHFLDACEIVCMSIIAFICSCVADRAKRNFSTFRMIVSSPKNYADALEVMRGRPECQGVIELLGHQLGWFQGKELGSVFTTLHRMTGFLDSPMIAANTASTSFPINILKTGEADAFLVVPPPMMTALAPLVRLWLGCFTRLFTQDDPSERRKLLVIVDEAAVLGRQKAIEEGITLMRGYGLRIWLIFQSLAQAQACFGENAQTVLDNLTTQHYFCISSLETAKTLSERIGDATLLIETINKTFGQTQQLGGGPNNQASRSTSRSITTAPHGRRLLQPNEILTLPDSVGLLFHKNMHVIPTRLARYYNAPEFAERRGSFIRGTGERGGLNFFTGVRAVIALAVAFCFTAFMIELTEQLAARSNLYRPAAGMSRQPYIAPGGYGQGFNDPFQPYNQPYGPYRPQPRYRR